MKVIVDNIEMENDGKVAVQCSEITASYCKHQP